MSVKPLKLLHLDKKDIARVLREMDTLSLCALSLVSKDAKKLVKKQKRKATKIDFSIGSSITIDIKFENKAEASFRLMHEKPARPGNHYGNRRRQLEKLDSPFETAHITYSSKFYGEETRWFDTGLSVRKWIDHFRSVFHHAKIDSMCLSMGIDKCDIISLRKTIEKMNVGKLTLEFQNSRKHFKMIMDTFETRPPKKLHLEDHPFSRNTSIHQILNQNIRWLRLGNGCDIQIEDLLSCNSSCILIDCLENVLSDKDLNLLIHLWLNGWNHKLGYLQVDYSFRLKILDKNLILGGLDYKEISENVKRNHRKSGDKMQDVMGGFDIKRHDGTLATIKIWEEDHYFELIVWK